MPGCPYPVRWEWEVSAVTLVSEAGRTTWPAATPETANHRALVRVCGPHGDPLVNGAILHARPVRC